jgi:hypothetical protein
VQYRVRGVAGLWCSLLLGATVAGGATLAVTTPAAARGVIIDTGSTGNWQNQTPCIYGGATCAGDDLGFEISTGDGLTDKIYVYSNGLVSLGAPIVPLLVPITSLAQFSGQNVFAPIYFDGGGSVSNSFVPHVGDDYEQAFRGFISPFSNDEVPVAFDITPFAGVNTGAFTLHFSYGDARLPSPGLAGLRGYQIGGTSWDPAFPLKDFSDNNSLSEDDIWINVDLASPVSASAAPEPSIWAIALLGFGGVGWALRRSARRRRTACA